MMGGMAFLVSLTRAAFAAPAAAADLTRSAIGQVIETAATAATIPVRAVGLIGQAELLINRVNLAVAQAEDLITRVSTIASTAETTVAEARAIATAAALTVEEATSISAAAGDVIR